ncbi:DNA-binding SARP family transcriptional activator [Streptomyces calvus]
MHEAIRQYQAFRRLLRDELGVEPSPLFTRMLPRYRTGAAPATAVHRSAPGGDVSGDVGLTAG